MEWIERNFYAPETKGAITLAPYQKAMIREALRTDEQGDFIYSTILWGDIKKSIKSTIAAAVILWRAFNTEWGSIKIVANDLKQADSRVAFYARRAIELNPALAVRAKIKPSGYLIELDNRTKIEAVPVDPQGEAGGNDDLICFSELWAAKSKAAIKMWTEMTLSPTKFKKSFRWIETYAGYVGESPLLEPLYEGVVMRGERLAGEYPIFVDRRARVIALWNTEPRLSWQTPEYYEQEAGALFPPEFRRVHRNEWVSPTSAFVAPEWWQGCAGTNPPLPKDYPLVFAADAGITSDQFALVAVSRLDDHIYTRYVRSWKPPPQGEIDFSEVEQEIRRLLDLYNVVEIAYDPYQLHDMMSRLRKEGAPTREFSQGADRAVADKQLHDLIRDRRLHHEGEAELTEHIRNANAKPEGEKHLRIVKRNQNLKIDLAVTLSMASYRALTLNL